MMNDARFQEAIRRFDELNSHDPRSETADGQSQPRELLFAQRVYECVKQLDADASEELLLAARAHTLERWKVPRDRYEMNTVGYHEWRGACAQHHADAAAEVLREVGYPPDIAERVRALILRKNWPTDADAQTLEDADCIVFLKHKFKDYVDQWDEDKTIRILRGTLNKMTESGRGLAMKLDLSERERALVEKAARKPR